jgi:hypothetical protein
MKDYKIAVKKRVKLSDSQYVDIALTGRVAETEAETGRKILLNVLNSGVIAVLRKEIVEPIENRHKRPEQTDGLKAA